MATYNKLVRDKIPDIIQEAGKTCRIRTLNDEEMRLMLQRKLHEEVQEYSSATTDVEALEELADMLEVMWALAQQHGATPEQLLTIQNQKYRMRGGFEHRIFLIDVDD